MILTEVEAKSKRCTLSLVLLMMDAERYNAQAARDPHLGTKCIGSACMQWCWYDYATPAGQTYRNSTNAWDKGRALSLEGLKSSPARGYCGLIGSRE